MAQDQLFERLWNGAAPMEEWTQAVQLEDYKSVHRGKIIADDGEYEVDFAARFVALGASYLTLVECKHVQALRDKVRSIGAHKGIMFATRGYQSGAIKYAKAHGIGIVFVADGRSCWLVKDDRVPADTGWEHVPDYIPRIVGWGWLGH